MDTQKYQADREEGSGQSKSLNGVSCVQKGQESRPTSEYEAKEAESEALKCIQAGPRCI